MGVPRSQLPCWDDIHPNPCWVDGQGALMGHPIPGPPALQVGLQVADPHPLVLDGAGRPEDDLPGAGRTLREATLWLRGAILQRGIRLPRIGNR